MPFLLSRLRNSPGHPPKRYVTSGEFVLSMGSSMAMQNPNHEEADIRIVVHVMHALQQGTKTIQVRPVDTDVFVVIFVGTFCDRTATQPFADILVFFDMGKNYRFYYINAICASLGEPRSRSLPVFHAFSGCDTTSVFNGKGNRPFWQAW